jgi:hypothetical protein
MTKPPPRRGGRLTACLDMAKSPPRGGAEFTTCLMLPGEYWDKQWATR